MELLTLKLIEICKINPIKDYECEVNPADLYEGDTGAEAEFKQITRISQEEYMEAEWLKQCA